MKKNTAKTTFSPKKSKQAMSIIQKYKIVILSFVIALGIIATYFMIISYRLRLVPDENRTILSKANQEEFRGKWTLVYAEVQGQTSNISRGGSLTFEADNTLSGFDGCNGFLQKTFSQYENTQQIVFSGGFSSLAGCDYDGRYWGLVSGSAPVLVFKSDTRLFIIKDKYNKLIFRKAKGSVQE